MTVRVKYNIGRILLSVFRGRGNLDFSTIKTNWQLLINLELFIYVINQGNVQLLRKRS